MTTAQEVLAEAAKHVGFVEGKNKDNPFGKWFGANHAPWCAQFVSYCISHAGGRALIAGAQTEKGFSSCGAGIKFFKKKKAWFSVTDAQPGDCVFFDWNKDGEQDHVGFVVKNDPKKKRVLTIEGNTNAGNSSNGGHCVKQWRSYTYIIGVGRPAYAQPVVAPTPDAPVTREGVK